MASAGDAVDPAAAGGDLSGTIIACAVVMVSVASLAVGMRFYARGKMLHVIASEDWCILAALIFSLVSSGLVIQESQVALGRRIATVSQDQITAYLHAAYFMSLFYHLSLCFTKVSILLLYIRVLTYDYIRKAAWVVMAIVGLYSAATFALHMSMCIPFEKSWDKSVPGECQGPKPWWAINYLHIITDFIIFLLPIPVVLRMTIPVRRKASLLLVFAMGFFVCLISILRTLWLTALISSTDMTWDLTSIANWSIVEINIAIVCACLMTYKPLINKFIKPWIHDCLPLHRKQRNSSGDPGSGSRPMTIGSMPLNAFHLRQGSENPPFLRLESGTGGPDEGTLVATRTGTSASNVKNSADIEIAVPPRGHLQG